jgi:hypothetical protein
VTLERGGTSVLRDGAARPSYRLPSRVLLRVAVASWNLYSLPPTWNLSRVVRATVQRTACRRSETTVGARTECRSMKDALVLLAIPPLDRVLEVRLNPDQAFASKSENAAVCRRGNASFPATT